MAVGTNHLRSVSFGACSDIASPICRSSSASLSMPEIIPIMDMDIQALEAMAFPPILATATMEVRFTGEGITGHTGKKQNRSNSLFLQRLNHPTGT